MRKNDRLIALQFEDRIKEHIGQEITGGSSTKSFSPEAKKEGGWRVGKRSTY